MRAGAALATALLAVSCAHDADGDVLVRAVLATEVPGPLPASSPEPAKRYPTGSRVVRLDFEAAGAAPEVLTSSLAAAGGAALSHDAETVVFVGRESETDSYAVWACAPDGSGLRRAVEHGSDCGAAAVLPDGRIVYSAAVAGPEPLPGVRSFALFVAPGDGSPGGRITFGGGCDLDPFVLVDGRIAYATYLPGEGMEAGRFAVFTVHPDGTGAAPLLGERGAVRPRVRLGQARDGTLFLAGRDGVVTADWGHPAGGVTPARLPIEDAAYAAPMPDGLLVVTGRDAEGVSGIWLGGPEGATVGATARPAADFVFSHAVPIAPRDRPQGHLSMVKPEQRHGLLLALDARHAAHSGATAVRLSRLPEGAGLARDDAQSLGRVALAQDGSFFARVPADTPLLLDLLGADDGVVLRGRTPFWVRPNEVRTCVGCHEPSDTAPPNRRPEAVRGEPADLTGRSSTGELR